MDRLALSQTLPRMGEAACRDLPIITGKTIGSQPQEVSYGGGGDNVNNGKIGSGSKVYGK